ncbi:hypothetical protein BGZ83_009293 [Gryganskiella cystojenkinii]|nr:hypothetical protein BGZ83_009293 [Gryganskiella cystojenkinii]
MNPLAIPEILLLISEYLNMHITTVCLRVSRTWYHTLVPRIWANVSKNLTEDGHGPSDETLSNHAVLIRSLELFSFIKSFDTPGGRKISPELFLAPNLAALNFHQFSSMTSQEESSLLALIQRHQSTLTELGFSGPTSDPFLEMIVHNCKNLRSLELSRMKYVHNTPERWVELFEPMWSRLQTLSIGGEWFHKQSISSELLDRLSRRGSRDNSVRDLSLHVQGKCDWDLVEFQLAYILKCPELSRLKWAVNVRDEIDTKSAMALLVEADASTSAIRATTEGRCEGVRSKKVTSSLLGQLESLSLPYMDFPNPVFKALLKSLALTTVLQGLDLSGTSFNQESWQLFKDTPRLLTSLRDLNLQNCKGVSGTIVHDIMCSMPSLETLLADYISDRDMLMAPTEAQHRSWVCLGLKKLYLAFLLHERESQPQVLARLSALTKLEYLSLNTYGISCHAHQTHLDPDDERDCSLRLNLAQGLDQLKNLSRLTYLVGPRSELAPWTDAETGWVKEHWADLRELRGFVLNEEAQRTLRPQIKHRHYRNPQQTFNQPFDNHNSGSSSNSNALRGVQPKAATVHPEILLIISEYLTRHTITIALRVCQAWYQILLSRVWITVRKLIDFPFSFGGTPEALSNHSSLIKSLELFSTRTSFDAIGNRPDFTCKHLSVLIIYDLRSLPQTADAPRACLSLLTLIQRHQRTLKTLITQSPITKEFLEVVQGCSSQLSTLDLCRKQPQQALAGLGLDQWMDHYDLLWSRVRTIALRGRWFDNPVLTSALLNRMSEAKDTVVQDLSLDLQDKYSWDLIRFQLAFIFKCSKLNRLFWTIKADDQAEETVFWPIEVDNQASEEEEDKAKSAMALLLAEQEVTGPIGNNGIPAGTREKGVSGSRRRYLLDQLESLSLPRMDFKNDDFKTLLGSLTALLELDLSYTNFDSISWRIMKDVPRVLTHVRALVLKGCREVSGSIVHEIMCSLTGLEVLEVDYISDRDMMQSPGEPPEQERPWVCLGLKNLCVGFLLHDRTSQPSILSRLSTLKRLEVLNLKTWEFGLHSHQTGIGYDDPSYDRSLRLNLSLDQSLDRLRGLRRLTSIVGTTSPTATWSRAEANWVKEHWVDLKMLSGFYCNKEVQQILSPDVKVADSFDRVY